MAALKTTLNKEFTDGEVLHGSDLNGITSPVETVLDNHADEIDLKLENENIIAGENISLERDGLDVTVNAIAGGEVATNHNIMTNRDIADQHPISAITDLQDNLDEIDLKVDISDIQDNLTSTDTNKPLSANQGKILNEKILVNETYSYSLTPLTSSMSVSGWRATASTHTTGIMTKGTYLMIFKFTFSSAQAGIGLTTTRVIIDGSEISPQTRITIPTGGATISGEIITTVTFSTSTTHTINADTYPLYYAITGGTQFIDVMFIKIKN